MIIRRLPYLGSFFVPRSIEEEANEYYKYIIDNILFYIREFENSISVTDILNMPYNLFQDLILERIRQKQQERQNNPNLKKDLMNAKF